MVESSNAKRASSLSCLRNWVPSGVAGESEDLESDVFGRERDRVGVRYMEGGNSIGCSSSDANAELIAAPTGVLFDLLGGTDTVSGGGV